MKRPAFSFIELMLVLSIFMLVLVYTAPRMVGTMFRNDIEVATQELVHVLRKANSQATTQVHDSDWGLKFIDSTTDTYVLYSGGDYATRTSSLDTTYTLPDSVSYNTISPQGGGTEMNFDQVTGETSHYGTIVLQDANGDTRTITVNSLGNVSSD